MDVTKKTMNSQQMVQFRRVHGRVVPIKINGSQPVKGTLLTGAGIGVAALGGHASAALHRDAAHYENIARNMKTKARLLYTKAAREGSGRSVRQAAQFVHQAAKNMKEADRFHTGGKGLQYGAFAVSSALIGAGVHKLLPKKAKEHPKTSAVVSAGSGLGAAFAIRSGYYKKIASMKTWDAVKLAAKRVVARGVKL